MNSTRGPLAALSEGERRMFDMIRKIFKWIGIVLGSLVGLLVLAFVVLYIIGNAKWNHGGTIMMCQLKGS
jgi:lipopolysaccharide/colanic/teichoic acid biosynthesis glycosyltransferase